MSQTPALQDGQTKSDVGEAVGEPAASAPPASGAVGDDLVVAAKAAIQSLDEMTEKPGMQTEFLSGSDLSEWETETIARAVITAFAPIIAERDAALAKLAAAEAALRKYGRHTEQCRHRYWPKHLCNCGFSAALATEKNDE